MSCRASADFRVDARVQGTLTLAMGVTCPVSGTVLRIEDDSFVVRLERGPTSYDVIREQRFVAKTFPGLEAPARLIPQVRDDAARDATHSPEPS